LVEGRLLTLEIDAIYGLLPGPDGRPTIVGDETVRAVWAWSPRARVLAVAAGVGDPGRFGGSDQEYTPGLPPDALVRLAASLDGPAVSVEGGPCFVFPVLPERLTVPEPVPLPIVVSSPEGRQAARRLIRPGNWQPGEWGELVDGRMGEWAMAVHDEEPVSICFSPASNAVAAEAGIWTRPDFRGRRLAPAVVAAWARRERRNKDVLFYSTTAGNDASRSVARTLGLTPLGWIWTVRETASG
jgi:hypothetical protein